MRPYQWVFGGIIAVAVAVAAVIVVAGKRPGTPGGSGQRVTKSAEIGEEAVLRGPTGHVAVAPTNAAYDRWLQLAAAGDKAGVGPMIFSGQIWIIPNETRCHVIGRGSLGVREVRVLEGDHAGQAGFVAYEYVVRPSPAHSVPAR